MPALRFHGGSRVTSRAAQPHVAGGRLDEARDHAQRRGLAAARGAEQHHELAVGDIERDVAHGVEVAVALG